MYQQATIPPTPWTGTRPQAGISMPFGPQYPTRLTVPASLGAAQLAHGTDTYVLQTDHGPYAVGIIRKVRRQRARVIII